MIGILTHEPFNEISQQNPLRDRPPLLHGPSRTAAPLTPGSFRPPEKQSLYLNSWQVLYAAVGETNESKPERFPLA
ncbi:MAG: hypothetical protein A4C66_06355 [Nitrospira sp. HN-bin3]|nr:MAG: hypothetical protein A4C66_06355 [Nitrospira sp. HN-bin3]